MEDYSRAINLNTANPAAYINRGNVHYERGEYTKAVIDYDKAIELDPSHEIARRNREVASDKLR